MKNVKKKGFTIVELVIVVAVIAILAAVLIPTFSDLVKKANMSADQVAVKNMNTVLAIEKVDTDDLTIDKVLEALEEAGFKAENYRPLTDGTAFYWVKKVNKIILVDEQTKEVLYPTDIEGIPEYNENATGAEKWYLLTQDGCEHEFGDDANWLSVKGKVLAPSCAEEGVIEVDTCLKCGETVEGYIVKAKGHDALKTLTANEGEEIIIKNLTINDTYYEEVRFESMKMDISYCAECGLPVAFVEELPYTIAGQYAQDISFVFRAFSKKPIEYTVAAGESFNEEISVFDIMYNNNAERITNAIEYFEKKDIESYQCKMDEFTKFVFGFESKDKLGALEYFGCGVTFNVSFNNAISDNSCAIGGQYNSHSPLVVDFSLSALDEYEQSKSNEADLLKSVVNYGTGTNFSVIKDIIEFNCGFANINIDPNENTVVTVNLVIENPGNENDLKVISSIKHKVVTPYANNARAKFETYKSDSNYDEEAIYKIVAEDGDVYYATKMEGQSVYGSQEQAIELGLVELIENGIKFGGVELIDGELLVDSVEAKIYIMNVKMSVK